MADARDPGFDLPTEPRSGNVIPITMKDITSPITIRLDEFIKQPAIREAIENHKSIKIPFKDCLNQHFKAVKGKNCNCLFCRNLNRKED